MTMKAHPTSLLLLFGLLLVAFPSLVSSGFVFPTYNKKVHTIGSGDSAPKQQQHQKEESSPPIGQKEQHGPIAAMAAIATGFSVAAILVATMTFPFLPAAVAIESGNGSYFAGSYSDPKHPNCKRVIEVVAANALLSGTDGTPGCPANGSGKEWSLQGKIIDSKKEIIVDFSPKGGPNDLVGQFFQDKTSSGINWPDGNTWTKK